MIGPDHGWRLAYLTGACLGLIVLVMRMWIPESPRWLMIHGASRSGARDRRRHRAVGDWDMTQAAAGAAEDQD